MENMLCITEQEKTYIDSGLFELSMKRMKEIKEARKDGFLELENCLKEQVSDLRKLSVKVSRIQF